MSKVIGFPVPLSMPSRKELSGRARSANYRARKNGIEGHLSTDDIDKQYRDQKGKCQDCDDLLYPNTDKRFHVDHLIPVDDKKNCKNVRNNIRILCASCNLKKHNKTIQQMAKQDAQKGIVHLYADTVPDLHIQMRLEGFFEEAA